VDGAERHVRRDSRKLGPAVSFRLLPIAPIGKTVRRAPKHGSPSARARPGSFVENTRRGLSAPRAAHDDLVGPRPPPAPIGQSDWSGRRIQAESLLQPNQREVALKPLSSTALPLARRICGESVELTPSFGPGGDRPRTALRWRRLGADVIQDRVDPAARRRSAIFGRLWRTDVDDWWGQAGVYFFHGLH